jgi:hypothetical protein
LELDISRVEEKLSIRSGPNFVEELGEEGKLLYGLGVLHGNPHLSNADYLAFM